MKLKWTSSDAAHDLVYFSNSVCWSGYTYKPHDNIQDLLIQVENFDFRCIDLYYFKWGFLDFVNWISLLASRTPFPSLCGVTDQYDYDIHVGLSNQAFTDRTKERIGRNTLAEGDYEHLWNRGPPNDACNLSDAGFRWGTL